MKKSYPFIILFLVLSSFSSFAVDQCTYRRDFGTLDESRSIREQHLIVLHESTRNAPVHQVVNHLNDFLREMCKMPYVHRKAIQDHKVEIHLLIGSIAQHSIIQSLLERNIQPRGHSDNWDKLPGVAGTAGRDNPAGSVPLIFNIASLYENHGSKNLVLHEMAHTLDHFLYKEGTQKNMISSTSEFSEIMDISPWEEIYIDYEPQQLQPVSRRPELDLSVFDGSPPSIREIYIQQARDIYEKNMAAYNQAIENNRITEKNNRDLREGDLDQLRYHQQHEEEHFAELYARWHAGADERYQLFSIFPEINNYLPSLEHE